MADRVRTSVRALGLRRLCAMFVVTLLTATAGVIAAPSAALAACTAASCNYMDPNRHGCTAYNRAEISYAGHYLQLRMSTNCWAMWARTTSDGSDRTASDSWIESRTVNRSNFSPRLKWPNKGPVWTTMFNASHHVRACFTVHDGNPPKPTVSTYCTNWF